MVQAFKNWNIEEMTGYKPQTTFYMDNLKGEDIKYYLRTID